LAKYAKLTLGSKESVNSANPFLFAISLTLLLRTHAGCADFVPARLDSGSSHYTVPEFEGFGAVLRKAANWIQMQRRVRVTNVQSIDYKLKHEAGLYCEPIALLVIIDLMH